MTIFSSRLRTILANKTPARGIWLSPRLAALPLPILRYDDPFLPFGKDSISATRDLACVYVFDLAAYMALGAPGVVALERTIHYANAGGDVLTVLHGPLASACYLTACGETAFAVAGVTVSDPALVDVYAAQHEAGVFVVGVPEWGGSRLVITGEATQLTVVAQDQQIVIPLGGDAVVYASRGEDFALAARARLLEMSDD
ncbi:MAG: hypothetical protein KC519_11300 [Anaerolineae bacterium]|nr:hypothetical protein [Anaerolineae bacterium]